MRRDRFTGGRVVVLAWVAVVAWVAVAVLASGGVLAVLMAGPWWCGGYVGGVASVAGVVVSMRRGLRCSWCAPWW